MSEITTATAIAFGNHYACALLQDQTVNCWGYNANGQGGGGSAGYSSTPGSA